ncbi:GNAT family N-acetyltransferase [Mucilaginibacter calamicampi]|uniref:GNAT family N-acetyltransferase n=1 Tax=Mucilaginibacter calamicampi TaxID=1302352 RepID=A0ABW2YVE1_9SPHI
MPDIRAATVDDVETIRQLADAIWRPTYSPILSPEQLDYMLAEIYSTEKITTQITQGQQTYLLLIEDGVPVAFAGYSPREEDADIYKLHKLYCLPSTQGKGYGKLLIDKVCADVIAAGKNILDLNVNRYNRAKSFYEKLGFVVVYGEDIPIGPYWMNDYVMRKQL